jgi:hypothetical protein
MANKKITPGTYRLPSIVKGPVKFEDMEAVGDFTTCIKHSSQDPALQHKAWCGFDVRYSFAFGGIDHAAYSAMGNSRLVPCGECVKAVMTALQSQLSVDTKDDRG